MFDDGECLKGVFGQLVPFFFNDTATTDIYTYLHTLSLHDALPIFLRKGRHAYQRGDADKGETRHADGAPAPLSNHALLIHLSPFICREGIACSYRFTTFQADQCSAQMENA